MVKNLHVAVITDSGGKCKYVAKVKMVDETTYFKLVNEANKIDANSHRRKNELHAQIDRLEAKVLKLEQEIKQLKGEE